MKILLVGAGFVGQRLGELLATLGHEAYGLHRSERELSRGIRSLAADVTDAKTLAPLPSDFDQLVFGVAPSGRTKEAYEAIYLRGVENLLARFPKTRFHLISSTAVYAESKSVVDETSAGLAETETAKILLEGESLVSRGADNVILRASGIYGPGRTRTIEALLASPPSDASRRELTNRVHRDDLARASAFFLERSDLRGIFNATDSSPTTLGEISDFLELEPLPTRLSLLRERRVQGDAPPRALRPGSARSSKPLSNRKLLETGFTLEYPSFREGYRAIFAEEIARER